MSLTNVTHTIVEIPVSLYKILYACENKMFVRSEVYPDEPGVGVSYLRLEAGEEVFLIRAKKEEQK